MILKQNRFKECGTCQYIIMRKGANYCTNPDSKYYNKNVDYDDDCNGEWWRLKNKGVIL